MESPEQDIAERLQSAFSVFKDDPLQRLRMKGTAASTMLPKSISPISSSLNRTKHKYDLTHYVRARERTERAREPLSR